MKRDLLKTLFEWKTDPLRMPIILRGARQVGKSWLVKEFGKSFECFIELNFDLEEEACNFFDSASSLAGILEKIELYTAKEIIPGKTLIFLDEIQESPRALKMLRYFKEQYPELHVIAAGSLLDFVLDEVGVPVGRVQFLFLYPLSFGEYLEALDRLDLRNHITTKAIIDPAIHKILLELLKTYMWLGGLPAVIDTWLKTRDAKKCQALQSQIIVAYQQDFLKYAKKNQVTHIDKVFLSIPQQLGDKFKYTKIDPETRNTTFKTALSLLIKAGVAYFCYHTPAQGLPLGANIDEKKFKVFFFDIGLAQKILGLDLQNWVTTTLDVKYIGAIAEQLVAQEYIAYSSPHEPCPLYYWHREEKNSNAEVDFVFLKQNQIVPTEVKSGVKGGLKSMQAFLSSHPNSHYGLKISQGGYRETEMLQEISFYALQRWLTQPSNPGGI